MKICKKIEPNYIYIYVIGLCGLLAGTVPAFLLPSDTASTDISEEWGQWNVLPVKAPSCVLIRKRNCTLENCTKEEYKYCKEIAHWSDWSPLQCKTLGSTCFIARTRNCSIQALKNCASNETNQDITVWGDMNTCPCRKAEAVPPAQGSGHWSEWTTWQCRIYTEHCYIYRTRQCSVPDTENCPPKESSQVKLWTDQCPCDSDSTSASTPTVGSLTATTSLSVTSSLSAMGSSEKTQGTDKPVTIATNTTGWQEWTEWECHNVDIGCMMHRRRQCSTKEKENRCTSEHYQLVACNGKTCNNVDNSRNVTTTSIPVTQVMWNPWGSWECHREQNPCVVYRYRNCSNNVEDDCLKQDGRGYMLGPCDERCNGTTIKAPTSTTATFTQAPIGISVMATPFTATPPDSAPTLTITRAPPMATEYASSQTLTTAIASPMTTEYASAPILTTTIAPTMTTEYVPVYWLEWSSWKCKIDSASGICVMAHTRNCSTFDVDDCERDLDGDHYVVVPCNSSICPDTWLDWGEWTCKVGNHGLCNMTRTRECSTGSNEDCGTESVMTKPCDQKLCPDEVRLQASGQCRDFDHKTCSDVVSSCDVITNKFHPICSSGDMASKSCPKSCGCCEEKPHWLEWSAWECSFAPIGSTCEMKRTRNCSVDDECQGRSDIVTKCDDKICPEPRHWLEWSAWECTLAPNRTCKMSRNRNCSSTSLDECVGESAVTTNCSNTVCPEMIQASSNVNCTGYDAADSNCTDGKGCSDFRTVFALNLVCGETKSAAECPVTCGCCVPSTTAMPTGQAPLASTSNPSSSANNNTTSTNATSTNNTTSNNSSGSGDITTSKHYLTTTSNPWSGAVDNSTGNTTSHNTSNVNGSNTSKNHTTSPIPAGVGSGSTTRPYTTSKSTGGVNGNSTSTNNTASQNTTSVGNTVVVDSSTGNTMTTTAATTKTRPTNIVTTTTSRPATITTTTAAITKATPTNIISTSAAATKTRPTTFSTTTVATIKVTPTTIVTTNGATTNARPVTVLTTSEATTKAMPTTILTTTAATTKSTSTTIGPTTAATTNAKSTTFITATAATTKTTPKTIGTITEATTNASPTPFITTTADTTKATPTTIGTTTTVMPTTIITTTTMNVKTTTHKQPYTIPPVPITCKVCAGPEFLCEKLYMDKQCEPPNNYCINKLGNHKDGTRMVTRSCGNFDTCYRDWFLGSSDSDKCRKFEDNNIITLDFDCTYCCINDNCNEPIRPSDATLYKDL